MSYIPTDPDTPEFARIRARGERLLTQAMAISHTLGSMTVRLDATLQSDRDWVGIYHQDGEYVIEAAAQWLERSTDAQVRAVFLHELGHAVHGDCLPARSRMTSWVGALLVVFNLGCGLMAALNPHMSDKAFFGLTMAMLGTLVLSLLGMSMYCYRNEFRADRFAVEHGEGEGMISDLTRFNDGFSWTHPPIAWRKKKMRSLIASLKGGTLPNSLAH